MSSQTLNSPICKGWIPSTLCTIPRAHKYYPFLEYYKRLPEHTNNNHIVWRDSSLTTISVSRQGIYWMPSLDGLSSFMLTTTEHLLCICKVDWKKRKPCSALVCKRIRYGRNTTSENSNILMNAETLSAKRTILPSFLSLLFLIWTSRWVLEDNSLCGSGKMINRIHWM